MEILTDITLDFVTVNGEGYPRINILGLNRPSSYSPDDFIVLEKYTIDRAALAQLNQAKKVERYQSVLYYISGRVYMSSQIYMGGYDLFDDPKVYDLTEFIEKGIARIVDSETDTQQYLYIYRIYYKNFSDVGSSKYVMGVNVGVVRGEGGKSGLTPTYGTTGDMSIMQGAGTLYRTTPDGIMVEKGIASNHVTQRYRGPIEESKERARRTALLGTQEYLEATTDEMYSSSEILYDDIETFGNRIVVTTSGVGVAVLTPEFDYYMNPFLFMDDDLYMSDGST